MKTQLDTFRICLFEEPSSFKTAVFTQLVLGTMDQEECTQQIKNLGLELDNKEYCMIAVKIQKVDHKDVFSTLSIKETLKETLDKISTVYEFGIGDKELFLLASDKKQEIEK